jgi:hypothetical protein
MLPHRDAEAAFTVMLRFPVWVRGAGVLESATCTEKFVLPVCVGVPVIAPEGESARPAGREVPFVRLNAYGATPPDAAKVAEYAALTVAAESAVVVRVSVGGVPLTAAAIASVSVACAVCGAAEESVTTKITEVLDAAAGVPVRTPPADKLNPEGRLLPDASAQV